MKDWLTAEDRKTFIMQTTEQRFMRRCGLISRVFSQPVNITYRDLSESFYKKELLFCGSANC